MHLPISISTFMELLRLGSKSVAEGRGTHKVGSDGPVHRDVCPGPLLGDEHVVVVSDRPVRRAETACGIGA